MRANRRAFWTGLGAILMACSVAGTAMGQGQRPGDIPFSQDDLYAKLSGQVLEFYDGTRAFYGADGHYEFRYTPDGPPAIGDYETKDSMVCVQFDNGFDRCDTIVEGSGRLVLIIEDGTRFPVRSVTPWDEGS